jgi:membrane protein implicated in regulation of membrane protease activity
MATWMAWLIASAVLVILEIFSGTFYLLMLAIGVLAGALTAYLGGGNVAQAASAVIVAVIAVLLLRRSKWGKSNNPDSETDHNVNLDIGQLVHVQSWQADGTQRHFARVQYRGASWEVQLQANAPVKEGACIIRAVHGNVFIVEPQP